MAKQTLITIPNGPLKSDVRSALNTDVSISNSNFTELYSDVAGKAPALGADDNYVTDAEKAALHAHSNKTALDNVTGVNHGDQDLSGYSLTSHNHNASYDAIGAASSAVTAHEAAADPHTQYSKKIASGSTALGTSAIANGACATLITVAATGVVTTDIVDIGYNSTPIGKTGYDPTAGAELSIRAFPTAGNVNFLVCNRTGASVTPAAMTINWRAVR